MSRKRIIAVIVSLLLLAGIGTTFWIFTDFNSNGYYWKCPEENYVSHKHYFSGTASKYAIAHHMKYGHNVTIQESE